MRNGKQQEVAERGVAWNLNLKLSMIVVTCFLRLPNFSDIDMKGGLSCKEMSLVVIGQLQSYTYASNVGL